jgi:hypothetical protein
MVKQIFATSVVADLCGYPALALNRVQIIITRPLPHRLGQGGAGAVG